MDLSISIENTQITINGYKFTFIYKDSRLEEGKDYIILHTEFKYIENGQYCCCYCKMQFKAEHTKSLVYHVEDSHMLHIKSYRDQIDGAYIKDSILSTMRNYLFENKTVST